jgi:hypothetical protein
MNAKITITEPKDMRPEVDGVDWFWTPQGDLEVQIAPMSDWRYEMLLAVHELTEAIMCKHNGVTQKQVDEFDQEYDKTHTTDCNAGDDTAAPYKREHCFATAIERILCAELGVDWKTYDDELASEYPGPSHKTP